IISYNNVGASGLQPGSRVIIPDGVKPQPVATLAAASAVIQQSRNTVPALTNYAVGGANGYAFGYCTWYVASRRSIPSNWGNAADWYYNAEASGWSVGSLPEAGAVAWSGAGYDGHVAIV